MKNFAQMTLLAVSIAALSPFAAAAAADAKHGKHHDDRGHEEHHHKIT